jgi:predicted metal-dependent phosphoesterase TrpH
MNRSAQLFLLQVVKEYNSKHLDIQKDVILKQAAKKAVSEPFALDLYKHLTGKNNVGTVTEKGIYKELEIYCKKQ